MQHQYWKTKQAISQKFGKKEDECIISSDAYLDTKLEFFRNIQLSCSFIKKIIDKYEESICYLSQEINSLGRFLKENSNDDKTYAKDLMLSMGKSLIFCAQQQLFLHEPLNRFHQELNTFCQRAIGDTIRNIISMEKARTEYRAFLSWMKNISQQLDPDTSKQLEKFKKVQNEVRRGKASFDKEALDCIQKVDLLAAARCNMMNHALSFYQSKLILCLEKSAKTFLTLNEMLTYYKEENTIEKTVFRNSTSCNANEFEERKKNSSEDDSHIADSKLIQQEGCFLESGYDKPFSGNLGQHNESSAEKCCENTVKSSKHDLKFFKSFCMQESQSFKQPLTQSVHDEKDIHNKRFSFINDNISMNKAINFENDESFLPSAILLESLDLSKNMTLEQDKNMCGSTKMDSFEEKANTWMNLFDDLDPLSKYPENLNINKNSFV